MSCTLNLWTHDSSLSSHIAIINYDLVAGAKLGDVFEVNLVHLKESGSEHDDLSQLSRVRTNRTQEPIYLMPFPLLGELKKKHPNLQLSVKHELSTLLGSHSREPVSVKLCRDKAAIEADHVVIFFRDQFISRSDMWRLSRKLCDTCVYQKQRVYFLGNAAGEIGFIWKNGKKCKSAYFSENTRPIFRSESAKFLIFIQMSEEMWHFEEDGELNYNKAIDGFLPDLFSLWRDLGAHHLISIILFTRVEYGNYGSMCIWSPDNNGMNPSVKQPTQNSMNESEEGGPYKDFFKVVVDNVSSRDWQPTLANLKVELAKFKENVLVQKTVNEFGKEVDYVCGRMTASQEGNFLEVINMAVFQFQSDYIDRDLSRTGTSIIIVTPGSGLYEVDEKMLHLTSKSLLNTVVGMDIVSLGKVPLFLTPMLRYKNPTKNSKKSQLLPKFSESLPTSNGGIPESFTSSISNYSVGSFLKNIRTGSDWLYTFPIGCNISFYSTTEMRSLRSPWENLMREHKFEPTAKMHELQMMGVLEAESAKISIPLLQSDPSLGGGDVFKEAAQEEYDAKQFVSNYLPRPSETFRQPLYRNASFSPEKEFIQDAKLPNLSSVSSRDLLRNPSDKDIDFKPRRKDAFRTNTMSSLSEKIRESSKKNFNVALPRVPSQVKVPSARSSSSNLKGFLVQPATATTSINPLGTKEAISKPYPVVLPSMESTAKINQLMVTPITRPSSHLKPNNLEVTNLSPTKGSSSEKPYQTPWKIIDNPFKLKQTTADNDPVSLRWEHLYMNKQDVRRFNWLSMCTPGALPLTFSYFPSLEELNDNFEEYTYTVGIDPEITEMNQQDLLTEMICQRLSRGYQIVVNPVTFIYLNEPSTSIVKEYSQDFNKYVSTPNEVRSNTVYLALGDSQFHCLSCDSVGYNIEVKRYVKKVSGYGKMKYDYYIWSKNTNDYVPSSITFNANDTANYNWNYVDQLISGFETYLPDSVKYWRARFVLIPTGNFSPNIIQKYQALDQDSYTEEELRVEGVCKLCEILRRGEFDPLNENSKKTPQITSTNSLGIKFTTLSLKDYINSELEAITNDSNRNEKSLFMPNKRLSIELDNYTLAKEMQGQNGPKIDDITWHYRVYENCFLGSEFVSWIVNTFTEINTREEALSFGNSLLESGLIEHIRKKHPLLDGHYIYRLSSEFNTKPMSTRPYRSWFNRKKENSTKEIENQKSLKEGPLRIELSRRILFDADPERKHGRSEMVTLHYDLLHNPSTCFHLRIEWLLATASVIENMLQSWSRILERYGLALVEAPIHEVSAVAELNPFNQVSVIKLAVEPPSLPEHLSYAADNSHPKKWWCIQILKYFEFILDSEGSDVFPQMVTAVYSWGKPGFRYVQYIHKTGSVLVQIDDDLQFLWLPNLLHNSKVGKTSFNKSNKGQNVSLKDTAEELKHSFTSFCNNHEELNRFYYTVEHTREDRRSITSGSSILSVDENDIHA
ncbi:DEP domain-containing protein [Schizosaccharomyces cryophilus OY26]|uniref:Vacuolar membrane-associated protein IML1 n=1 Tax=Schizosaccharomyces cryophilus (strain OY26 / ATCC MYA-4695 / CBS 11777 / NBRC 106824 / NRRL Y48691) TaxID=653667 RepID=S9XIY3_SCHCR|nr:DEP domain-containing protein [Schizosaccharomyces cryophilus OY26]EPY53591.1 DEP domain-containing protein [Schizosaccharomyces cryophilus OY26]